MLTETYFANTKTLRTSNSEVSKAHGEKWITENRKTNQSDTI